MNRSEVKAEIASSFGSLLTNLPDDEFSRTVDFGKFSCSVENFDNFRIIQRQFETAGDSITIPFSSHDPGVQMVFSLNGQSVLNNHFNPFVLSPRSHSLNFFNPYNCQNILHDHARQHDIVFHLKESFHSDLITNYLSSSEERLPAMILQKKEFITLNEHIPVDAGIMGLLKNILECPFKGDMRSTFIREHIRALLTLQFFHFNGVVTGKKSRHSEKITKRDQDILGDVKKHINENFLDPSSLETLSKQFGINEFKLKHGFRLLFETSPMRYLQYKRLEFSLFLLRETDKTIKVIADEIGYSHATNFTIAFTKAFGKSPLHYRTGERQVLDLVEV